MQLEAVQRTLVELQHEVRQQKDEVAEKNKRNKTEIKTLKDLHEKQVSSKPCSNAQSMYSQTDRKQRKSYRNGDEFELVYSLGTFWISIMKNFMIQKNSTSLICYVICCAVAKALSKYYLPITFGESEIICNYLSKMFG